MLCNIQYTIIIIDNVNNLLYKNGLLAKYVTCIKSGV